MADMGKAFPTTNGVWSATTQYERLCIVTYNGSSYISTNSTINDVPGQSSNWQLIASKGDIGPTGIHGTNGTNGRDADLNYLSGDAVPINTFRPMMTNTDLNADGSGKTLGNSGNDSGWAYVYASRNTFTGKFNQVIHDFDGKSLDTIKFYCFKSLSANVATTVITKNIGVDGKQFDLDTIVPSGNSSVAVSVSNATTGKVALYSSFVDTGNYYEPYGVGNQELFAPNLYSPFTGSVRTIKRNHTWYIRGDIAGYTLSDTSSQSICYLPFSTGLITFKGSGDSSGSPVLVIFGNQLSLQKTVGTGGTVRFSWSIPEELL